MTQDEEMGNLDQSLNNDPRLATILKLPRPVRAKAIGCALAGLLALGSLGGVLAQVEVSSNTTSPATGHAQVIAHAVVDLGDGEVNWKVAPA